MRRIIGLFREIGSVLKATVFAWQEDNASRLAAALAFYTIFSLAPAALIVLAVAEMIVGHVTAEAEMAKLLEQYLGAKGTSFILSIIDTSRGRFSGTTATVIGVVGVISGATVVFAELKSALNEIWNAPPSSGGAIRQLIIRRLISFVVVIVLGVFLVLSVAASTTVSLVTAYFAKEVWIPPFVLHMSNFTVSFGLMCILFMLMFRYLPDIDISWRDTAVGAIITALLFTIGKSLIGVYLGRSGLVSVYGAAGSFVIILIFVYYSTIVLFFGAELTQVYVTRFGHGFRRGLPMNDDDKDSAETENG